MPFPSVMFLFNSAANRVHFSPLSPDIRSLCKETCSLISERPGQRAKLPIFDLAIDGEKNILLERYQYLVKNSIRLFAAFVLNIIK